MEKMDTQRALQAVERLQAKLKDRGEAPTEEKLSALKTVLQSPLFHQILTMQASGQQGKAKPSALRRALSEAGASRMRALAHSNSYDLALQNSSRGMHPDSPSTLDSPQTNGDPDGSERVIRAMAQGRCVTYIDLTKPVSGELGFSLVATASENGGEGGIFVKEVQPGSATHSDGKLKEADQILAIDGRPLDRAVSPRQATGMLQSARERVRLTVARGPVPETGHSAMPQKASTLPLCQSKSRKQEVETIVLQNNRTGLGFGIVGRKPSGVMVKTILPGGIADMDGRLRSGDCLLRIGDTDLSGMGSEQVAKVLQQCGSKVILVVSREAPDETPDSSQGLPPAAKQKTMMEGPGYGDKEVEEFCVELTKDTQELGITIAGYIGDTGSSEPSGIFVKSIIKDSPVEQDGRIQVGDQIIAVDGTDIQGYTNEQAVEFLKNTGKAVHLKLVRWGARLAETLKSSTPVAPHKDRPPETVKDLAGDTMNMDTTRGAKLTATQVEELKKKWESLIGLSNDIVIAQVEKFSEYSGLGISLEARSGHHYICSILPEGPVGRSGKILIGDELLEVNGVCLIGETHKEVISILKELPVCVCMACCRPAQPAPSDSSAGQSSLEVSSSEPTEKVQGELAGSPVSLETDDSPKECMAEESRGSPLAMWETEIRVIELEKGDAGLGFSILDYQDPLDPAKTVTVIRSLVPNGVAELDGHLLPGDRLMFVNNTNLENASLDDAVQALKGAALGRVRIGVAKPLPVDSNDLDSVNEKALDRHHDTTQTVVLATPADLDKQTSAAHKEERRSEGTSAMEGSDKQITTSGAHFERTITVAKGNSSLGLTVSANKGGSGVIIRSIVHGGSISQDGRLGVGDCILAINGESTTRLTNAQARALLRRQSLIGPDISVTYVPAEHLKEYRAAVGPIEDEEVKVDAPPITRRKIPELPERVEEEREEKELQSVAHDNWNQPRKVELYREPGKSLGISIMGGRGMGSRLSNGEVMRGIFIKHILEDSPAGRNGTLKTGDRIVEVGGADLREASHEQAVEAIRKAGDPVVFWVQGVGHAARSSTTGSNGEKATEAINSNTKSDKGAETQSRLFLSPANPFTPTPFKPPVHRDSGKISPPIPRPLNNPVVLRAGETNRGTPTGVLNRPALPLKPQEEEEDEFGYSWRKMVQRYGSLPGELHMIELEKGQEGLGLDLGGNKDRSRMSVFVVGIDPGGAAGRDRRIRVGDELLEINGQILYGRTHQNASSIIKRAPSRVKIVFIRNMEAVNQMAVGPGKEYGDVPKTQTELDTRGALSPSAVNVDMSKSVQHIVLAKGPGGFGIDISEEDTRSGAVIRSLSERGTAKKEGRIKPGDRILAVDGQTVVGLPVEKVVGLLQSARSKVKLTVCTGDSTPPSSSSSSSSSIHPGKGASDGRIASVTVCPLLHDEPPGTEAVRGSGRSSTPDSMTSDPLTCPIIPGCETTIDICKGHTGLGLSIVGGRDTLLGVIVIHEIYEEGAASKDGRLWAGDQILEVNGVDLRTATHEEAMKVLRQTAWRVCMTVFREEAQYRQEDLWDVFSVELSRKPGQALGLGVVGKRNDTGVFVSDIEKGGAIEEDGTLTQGDQILAVNGEDVRASTQETVAAMLKTSESSSCGVTPCTLPGSGSFRGESDNRHRSDNSPDDYVEVRTVTFAKGPADSLGFSIAGGVGSPLGDVPIHVATVRPTGLAAQSQKLKIGDRIVSICGTSTEGMSQDQAASLLRDAPGAIKLQVVSGGDPGVTGFPEDQLDCIMFRSDLGPPQYKTIVLDRGSDGLGFSIVGGFGSPHGDLPIYVKSVFSKGAASKDGRLQRGDQIVAVNGQGLEGVTHEEAVKILKRTKGTVTLIVL